MITVAELYRVDSMGRKHWKRVPSSKESGARLASLCTDVTVRMEADGQVHISVSRQSKLLLSWDLNEPDPPSAAARVTKQRAATKVAIKHIVDTLGK